MRFNQPSSRPFEAKFPGICESCGDGFDPGDQVMYEGDDLVHADPDQCSMRLRNVPDKKPCTNCWMVHAGECL